MPKLKVTQDDFNLKELEDAEYNEGDFDSYDGPLPSNGQILPCYVKSIWWTYSQSNNAMLKVLVVADETAGDFEGCTFWENLALQDNTKFRWQPFFNVIGITIRDVFNKTFVTGDQENFGEPITKIADWKPGAENDEAYLRVVAKIGHDQDGNKRPEVKSWLPYESADAADDEPEDEPELEEEEPEEEPEVEADEDEEEAPPARGRKAPAAGRGRTAKPATRSAGTTARGGRPRAAASSRATRGGKAAPARGRRGSTDEPPF
jgi:hypothetical protein